MSKITKYIRDYFTKKNKVHDIIKNIMNQNLSFTKDFGGFEQLWKLISHDTRFITVQSYTSETGMLYKIVNDFLRNTNNTETKLISQYLSLMKEELYYLPRRNQTLFRGMANIKLKHKLNEKLVISYVMSTSYSEDIASSFLENNGTMYIICPTFSKKSTGYDISSVSLVDEKEIIFLPGTKFLVINFHKRKNIDIWTLQEIISK